jgi:hypothetical protein
MINFDEQVKTVNRHDMKIVLDFTIIILYYCLKIKCNRDEPSF